MLAFLFSRPVLYVTVGGQDEIKKTTGRYVNIIACASSNIEIFAKYPVILESPIPAQFEQLIDSKLNSAFQPAKAPPLQSG